MAEKHRKKDDSAKKKDLDKIDKDLEKIEKEIKDILGVPMKKEENEDESDNTYER